MLAKTHNEGGRTAIMISMLISYSILPIAKDNYPLIFMSAITAFSAGTTWAVIADQDQNEQAIPLRNFLAYLLHIIIRKIDNVHRGVITHCALTYHLIFLPLMAYIWISQLYTNQIYLLLFIYCLTAWTASMMHLVLDRFTTEGVYKWWVLMRYLYLRVKREFSQIKADRKSWKTSLVHKEHSYVLMPKYPFYKKIPLGEFGRTGTQYEVIFRTNLMIVNNYIPSLVLIFLANLQYGKIIDYVKIVFGVIPN